MKVLVLFALLVGLVNTNHIRGYHRAVGIPTAERIRQKEGTPGLSTRIINGTVVQLGSYPHFAGLIVVLESNLISVCGSTLITSTKLVTAAHCWDDGEDQPELMQVVLGSTTLFSGGTRINTNQIVLHEEFSLDTVRNDIAIVTITAVTFNAYIKPINLPGDPGNRFVDVTAQVIGYGMTNDTAVIDVSQQLSYVNVTVLPDPYCLIFGSIFTTSMICTEGTYGGPCMGDSGGPLLYRDNASGDILIGVVSFGADISCTLGLPTVFTRITSYVEWIKNNI